MANLYNKKPLTRDQLKLAKENSKSAMSAARFLKVSYNTFVKYAKKYDVWKPRPSSAGISRARKVTWSGLKPLDVEIDLQKQLIKEFVLPQRCSCCGESRQRKTDLLTPLIVHFINGDINDKKPSNLRFFCYNCYFLEHPNKHKTINKDIGRTFEEQQDIEEDGITGDELAKELGSKLSDLFGKN